MVFLINKTIIIGKCEKITYIIFESKGDTYAFAFYM